MDKLCKEVVLLYLFCLLCIFLIAADKQCHCYCNGDDYCNQSSVEDESADKGAYYKGNSCCEEPSSNYAYHSCNTEDCALPSPSPVCKAGTHCHHKGYIGGRKG